MTKKDIVPGFPDQEEYYDKMSIVQIALNEEKESSCSLTGMLNTLLSMSLRGEQKVQILQEEYHIELDTDLERKVDSMSNLGEYAVEYGYRKGMQRGKEEGLHTGRETVIISMLRKHISSAEIASMTDIPLETVREIEQRMMAASL